MLGVLPGLPRVCFVHDYRKSVAVQFGHRLGDHRKLLNGGDEDVLALLQRLFELLGGLGDRHHGTGRLLELLDGALELLVEDAPVGTTMMVSKRRVFSPAGRAASDRVKPRDRV